MLRFLTLLILTVSTMSVRAEVPIVNVAVLYGTTPQVTALVGEMRKRYSCLRWGYKSIELATYQAKSDTRDRDNNGLDADIDGWNFNSSSDSLPAPVAEVLQPVARFDIAPPPEQISNARLKEEEEVGTKNCLVLWPVVDEPDYEKGYTFMVKRTPQQFAKPGWIYYRMELQLYVPSQLGESRIRNLPSVGVGGQIITY